ncbi:MAG: trypsin-like peptidase domain-containing protein [Nitriliruptorales bacterium]|nr:trypsin-like peptidase domain-containing protein [Nitriliruptorales bacterium]
MGSIQQRMRDAATGAGNSVVAVGHGAGVVIEDGLVLTNAHNVTSREPSVQFSDRSKRTATVRGADLDGDLAVLEVDTDGANPLGWGEAPEIGDEVTTVAPTRSGPRVTVGYVAAAGQTFRGPRGRPVTGAIEHTAPLARGSSGSPILDTDGRLVGINTHRRRHGFYLAVPSTDDLRATVEALASGETLRPPRLGIAVAPPQIAKGLRAAVGLDDRPGLLIRDVTEDSPAARAGLGRGDLIVAAGDEEITEVDQLFSALAAAASGTLHLTVVRGEEERQVAVPLAGETEEEGAV